MGRKRKMREFTKSPASITINEAFQRLHLELKEKNGYITCERFNIAVREDRIGLQVDGVKVKPDFFATHLRISIEETSGGGWTAKMAATRALERPVNEYEWTVSASDVGRYVTKGWPTMREDEDAVTSRIPPGPKAAWKTWVTRWLILTACEGGAEQLQNVDVLVEEAREYLTTELKAEKIFVPKDNKLIRRHIKDLLTLIRQ